jgi:hypothetical protein
MAAIVSSGPAGGLRASPDITTGAVSDAKTGLPAQTGDSGERHRSEIGRKRAMSSSNRLSDKLGGVAGVAFCVLAFVGVASVDPVRGASDQKLLAWWADAGNRNALLFSMYAMLLACPCFLLFVSRLRSRLQPGEPGGWSDLVYASGIVVTGALGVVAVIRGVIAASMRFHDEPLPGVDTLRFQTNLLYAIWDVAILFTVVLIAIASILAFATRAQPRWLSWLGVVVSVGSLGLLAAQIAPISLPLLYIWVLANSVLLWRSPAPGTVSTSAWQPEAVRAQA